MNRFLRPKYYWSRLRNASQDLRRQTRCLLNKISAEWFRSVGHYAYIRETRSACAEAEERECAGTGTVYVDVSVIAEHDGQSGIQRVVRSVAFLLAATPQAKALQLRFVYVKGNRHRIVELAEGGYLKTDEVVEYRCGDTFLGLDFSLDSIWHMRGRFSEMKRQGVKFWYLIHDFLPITNPEWFSDPTVLRFFNWMAIVAATANGYFCVSSSTRDELRLIMAGKFGLDDQRPAHVIPMGSDIAQSRPTLGIPEGFDQLVGSLADVPTVMMVGTVEPRKGHRLALRAMEHLWAQGRAVNLVMVGGAGWKTADLVEELQTHPLRDKRLFWTGKISDEVLDRLYGSCTGLLFPSYAEGFGLPVVEALGHGKPVLARQLKVYAQHEGKGVSYFPAHASPEGLANSVADWLDEIARGDTIARPDLLPGWDETSRFIMDRFFPVTVASSSKESETTPCTVAS